MTGRDDPGLPDDLADAVLDGAPIDWGDVEAAAGRDVRFLQHLRLVASVADVYRQAAAARSRASRESAAPAVAAEERWGHLRLLERVGRGAFGEVFRAWDTRLDREVALKLLDAETSPPGSDSTLHEGRLLARVRHPNVVTIHGAEQIGTQIGLWMEFVRGRTLDEIVRQGTIFTSADVVRIGIDLSRAVAAVHAAGLLHRDIKAQNVIQAADGRVVLMDFGAGKTLDDSSRVEAGTPLYLAPEVLAGQPATVQSDVYSVGVLLYYLLTGSYPVRGRSIEEVRLAHARHQGVPIRRLRPAVRASLARVVERACDARRERRHASADALATDLERLDRRPAGVRLFSVLAAVAAAAVLSLLALDIGTRLNGDTRSFRARLASAIGGLPGYPERPVMVVLPFRTASTEPGTRLLLDHITAGMIRQLGIIDGLEVRSLASSFMLKDRPRDLGEIGRRLRVNLVVEGEAQVSGDTVRVTAALVTIENDRIWSGAIERRLSSEGDLVSVVEDLTRTIVNELRMTVGRTQRRYDTLDIPTLEIYLQARTWRDARLLESQRAVPLLQEVIRKDGSFAPALALLAVTYAEMTFTYPNVTGTALSPGEAAALMKPLTDKALSIDPTLAEGHAAEGYLHTLAGRWTMAEDAFRRAIDYEPNQTSVYGDFVLSTLLPWGRIDDALQTMEAAVRADPLSLDARRLLARTQVSAGLHDEALTNCRQVLDEDPNYQFVEEICGLALMFQGRMDEAMALFEKRAHLNEHWIAYIHALSGRRAEAAAIAASNGHLPHRQAMIYAALGDSDRAFAALDRLAALNPRRAAYYLNLPELANVRRDSRANVLLQRLGFPE